MPVTGCKPPPYHAEAIRHCLAEIACHAEQAVVTLAEMPATTERDLLQRWFRRVWAQARVWQETGR
jgi:hypothetical protein